MHVSGGGGNKSKQGFRELSHSYVWRQPTAPCYPNPGETLLFTHIIWSWSRVIPPPPVTPQTYRRRSQTLLFTPPSSLPLYMRFALSWSPSLQDSAELSPLSGALPGCPPTNLLAGWLGPIVWTPVRPPCFLVMAFTHPAVTETCLLPL